MICSYTELLKFKKTIKVSDSIDKLPLGIYKSMMAKAYRSVNQPMLYYENIQDRLKIFNATEMYSPIHNSDYSLEREKKKTRTRRLNSEIKNKSQQAFLEDYFESLNQNIC